MRKKFNSVYSMFSRRDWFETRFVGNPEHRFSRVVALCCLLDSSIKKVTSCFVYKVMGLTFHNRINTQLSYRFKLAQVVATRNTKPQRIFLGSNLTGCSFLIQFYFYFYFRRGRGSDFIILFMSGFFFLFNYFSYYFLCLEHV